MIGRLRRLRLRGAAGERGAVAVSVVILFPLFLGAAALAVDTAALWNSRAQVITGADATALAVATDCARNQCVSRSQIAATQQHYWQANTSEARLENLVPGSTSLQVDDARHTYRTQSTWTIQHYFAGLFGVPDVQLTADSTARFAGATSADAQLPVAVSWCAYQQAISAAGVGSPQSVATLPLRTDSTGSCTAPNGGTVAGGSTLLRPGDGTCTATSSAGSSITTASTSRAAPAACTAGYLAALRGTDIQLPVYDQVSADGSSLRVYGYAAFRVTGVTAGSPTTVTGYFTYTARQIDTPSAPLTAPDLGARVVFLA